MATSLQRIMVMTLTMLIVVVMAHSFYNNATNYDDIDRQFGMNGSNVENWSSTTRTGIENSNPDTSTVTLSRDYGNTRYGMGQVWKLFSTGLGTTDYVSSNPAERRLEIFFNWIMGILSALLILEGIFMIYMKKYS